jgi:uncharacterized protein YndB with AHSA1/START domain
MSASPEHTDYVGTAGNVTPLTRPLIRQSTLVRSDVDHTFEAFVRTIGTWWPLQLSRGRDRVRDVTVEPRSGGRVFETWDDGTTVDWGELTVWAPPERLVMTWTSTPRPTEVELTFQSVGPTLTRVAVEHRGWENLTDAQLREDCAAPGGYSSGAYAEGWARILEDFSASLRPDHHSSPHEDAPA